MRYGIGEVLKMGAKLEGEAQLKFMRENFTQALGKMIEYALEPEYQWDLPPGTPPFKPNQFLDQESNLYSEVRRMYIFMKDQGSHVSPLKKEVNFVQLLENVSPDDAQFLVCAKEKTLPFGWTAEKIREVYPGLIYPETEENHQPNFERMTNEELGQDDEVVPEPLPLTLTDEKITEMMLTGQIPVGDIIYNPEDLDENKPRKPGRPKGSPNKTNTVTPKSGTQKKKPTAKKPVVKKTKVGEG